MGFTGSYVACRCPGQIAEFEVLTDYDDGCEWSTAFPGGWQVGQWAGEVIAVGGAALIDAVAGATGAPALMGYVYDSSCVVLDAANDRNDLWRGCLARGCTAAAAQEEDLSWLGLRPGPSLAQLGLLEPADAAERALIWARNAMTVASPEALQALFNLAQPDGPADGLFFELLTALGVT